MIGAMEIQEKLIEWGIYKRGDGTIRVENQISKNAFVYSVEKKGFGLVDAHGNILLPPMYKFIRKLNDDIVLLCVSRNKRDFFGAYKIEKNSMVVNCCYDYVQINQFDKGLIEYVDFYKGINSYTLGVGTLEQNFFINRYVSQRMLEMLEDDASLFMKMDSVYFRDKDEFDKCQIDSCLEYVEKGIQKKIREMTEYGLEENEVEKRVASFRSLVSEKISFEKEEIVELRYEAKNNIEDREKK